MSSPPAPTFPSHYSPSTLSLKRPGPTSQLLNPAKRRKASTSSSTHPLRQASFPPPDGPQSPSSVISYGAGAGRVRASYSPSVDGSRSVTSSRAPGRKSKKRQQQATGADSASAVSAGTKKSGHAREASTSVVKGSNKATSADARSAKDGPLPAEDEEVSDDDDPDDDNAAIWALPTQNSAIEDTEDRENLARLLAAFSDEQYDQYEVWRRAKLDKNKVKKLVNSTLSQSVSDDLAKAVMGVTKLFVGELVERARAVQDEWLAAAERLPTGERNVRGGRGGEVRGARQEEGEDGKGAHESNGKEAESVEQNGATRDTNMPDAITTSVENDNATQSSSLTTEATSSNATQETNGAKSSFTTLEETQPISPPTSPPKQPRPQYKPLVQERDRGPLTPDHLREALRRYKKDREGGSVGWQGMSLQGIERAAPRTSGRRLFR